MTDDPLLAHLDADDDALDARWQQLGRWVEARFGKRPDVEALLFLVGLRVQGRGFEPDLEREAKQALIMEGTYAVFERLGLYEQVGMEADGSWIWERLRPTPAGLSIDQQEKLLKTAILTYFDDLLDAPPA